MDKREREPERRAFLQVLAATAAAGGLVSCSRAGGGAYWRFFTDQEAATVVAICEQLIPADDAPGATEAGVAQYIDLQLTKHHQEHQAAYRQGIAEVDAKSQEQFGAPFRDLDKDQQSELLFGLEGDEDDFFSLILEHTIEGFYGDPRHGGNRGAVSWRMVGLPTPPVRGRLPYEPVRD